MKELRPVARIDNTTKKLIIDEIRAKLDLIKTYSNKQNPTKTLLYSEQLRSLMLQMYTKDNELKTKLALLKFENNSNNVRSTLELSEKIILLAQRYRKHL